MKQYLEILSEILEKGVWKDPARPNMPRTLDVFSIEKRFDLQKGFPLVTTKYVNWQNVLKELLWFLKGDTNITDLVNGGVNIWNKDAYKYYLRFAELNGDVDQNDILHDNLDGSYRVFTFEEFMEHIKKSDYLYYKEYRLGDLGRVYGAQWRDWRGYNDNWDTTIKVDQIKGVISSLRDNPLSRYHVVTAWNPVEINEMALPPCHMMFMFNCRQIPIDIRRHELHYSGNFPEVYNDTEETLNALDVPKYYIDCKMVQRSCDSFLGVPYNIASYALLTHIIAKMVNMVPGEFIWSGNSVHIYDNHMEQVSLQLLREPYPLPQLVILKDSWGKIEDIQPWDFQLIGYVSHPAIKAHLSVGLEGDNNQ